MNDVSYADAAAHTEPANAWAAQAAWMRLIGDLVRTDSPIEFPPEVKS
jgi:hypothetical protein